MITILCYLQGTDFLGVVHHMYNSSGSDSEDEERERKKQEQLRQLHLQLQLSTLYCYAVHMLCTSLLYIFICKSYIKHIHHIFIHSKAYRFQCFSFKGERKEEIRNFENEDKIHSWSMEC